MHSRHPSAEKALAGRFSALANPLDFDLSHFRALLAQGLNPNLVDEEGEPLLHILAQLGESEAIKLAIEAGADIHQRDPLGNTALTKTSSIDCALLLMQHGLSPTTRNHAKQFPTEVIRERYQKLHFLQPDPPILELLYNCAEVETDLKDGRSPMEAWNNIWDEIRREYRQPQIREQKLNTLPYLLHKSREIGQPVPKAALQDSSDAADYLRHAIGNGPYAAAAWRDHCALNGEPMRPEEWTKGGLIAPLMQNGRVACLFSGDYWLKQRDLQPLYELFDILPHKGKYGVHPAVSVAFSETLSQWALYGAGKDLGSFRLMRAHMQMPAHLRQHWPTFQTIYLERKVAENANFPGR